MEAKDRKYYSNPSQARGSGHFNPPAPESLIQQLAAMKLQQPTSMAFPTEHQQPRYHTNRQQHSSTKAIQGISMEMPMIDTSTRGSSSTSTKRQRIEDYPYTQTDMAGPAQQASQQP